MQGNAEDMILIELTELNKRLAERFCLNCTKDCTFCEIKEVGRITESMPIYRAEDSVSRREDGHSNQGH